MTKSKEHTDEKEVEEFMQGIIKRYPWQRLVMVIFIIAVLFQQLSLYRQFQHIPGPIYGGDLYRERGHTLNIINGNPFWTDPYFLGEYEHWAPLGYIIAAGIVKTFSVDVEKVLIFLPIFTTLITAIAAYILGKEIFKDETYALLFALAHHTLYGIGSFKFTFAMGYFFMIMFLYFFLREREEENSLRLQVLGGICLGLVALSHFQPLVYTICIIGAYVLFEIIYQRRGTGAFNSIKDLVRRYWLMFIIGVSISMIFFGPLIVKYHMHTANPTNKFCLFDANAAGLPWFLGLIRGTFFGFTSLKGSISSLLALGGLAYCLLNIRKTIPRFILFALIGMYMGSGHYLITLPLFDFVITPPHISEGLGLFSVLLVILGIRLLAISLGKVKHIHMIFAASFFLIFLLPSYAQAYGDLLNNQWVKYGMQMDPGTKVLFDIGDWMRENIGNDEAILANDESAFMITAMSGKKVVASRRTHASTFADVDKRYADAAVMLFGDDDATTKDLLRTYKVRYVYLDQFIYNNPLLVNPKYSEYLRKNNVNFTMQRVPLDPSTVEAPRFDYLVVSPQEVRLLRGLIQAKAFMVGDKPYSFLFAVNTTWSGQ